MIFHVFGHPFASFIDTNIFGQSFVSVFQCENYSNIPIYSNIHKNLIQIIIRTFVGVKLFT